MTAFKESTRVRVNADWRYPNCHGAFNEAFISGSQKNSAAAALEERPLHRKKKHNTNLPKNRTEHKVTSFSGIETIWDPEILLRSVLSVLRHEEVKVYTKKKKKVEKDWTMRYQNLIIIGRWCRNKDELWTDAEGLSNKESEGTETANFIQVN